MIADPPTVRLLTPSLRPAGGVIKLFDYLVHALELGYRTTVHCPALPDEDDPLFRVPRFGRLREHPWVEFHDNLSVSVGPGDWALFSWPPHYEQISRRTGPEIPHERVIHLVQNTRHANPAFADGYALRLLSRPMCRIMVAHQVMDACMPHLNPTSMSRTIVEGHDWGYFHLKREGELGKPLRIGYTTWKSDVGVRVEAHADRRCLFRSLSRAASWHEIRELLHWCDVFLCCPGPEEGFYLPGLEALAAGAIVITPDVGGNRAYCRFGENCIRAELDNAESYGQALDWLEHASADEIASIRRRGYAVLEKHTLARERSEFASLLVELGARLRTESRCPRPTGAAARAAGRAAPERAR